MAWVHYQKHVRGNEEIIISKSGNLSIPKKLRQKDNINIFFDEDKKLIGITFCEKQAGSRKIPVNGCMDIKSLLTLLKIKLNPKKHPVFYIEDNMHVFSYEEFLEGNNNGR